MSEVLDGSLRDAAHAISRHEISPVELTSMALERIHQQEGAINAYTVVLDERALAAATMLQEELVHTGPRSPLHGIPIAIKDLIDIADLPTTCSSPVRNGHIAGSDATVVARLEQAGAVVVGKTHLHPFAYGPMTPATSNPWDTTRIPGGSSGGSGATVAARGCFLAIGTDTGGSIRVPAALCGTVGLKPTFGLVSRSGVVPLSWSLDHVGPLTRTISDAAVAMQVIAGFDPTDPASVADPVLDFLDGLDAPVSGLRLGVPQNFFFDRLTDEVGVQVQSAIDALAAAGATLVPVEIPMVDKLMGVEYGILLPEASAFHRDTLRTHRHLYADDIRRLLEAGELISAVDYVTAVRTRGVIQQAWQAMFRDQDLAAVIAPTSPIVAPARTDSVVAWPDGTEESTIDALIRLSAAANVTGLPSVAVPCGLTPGGLPTSLQIIGRPFDDVGVMRLGMVVERASGFGEYRPPLLAE